MTIEPSGSQKVGQSHLPRNWTHHHGNERQSGPRVRVTMLETAPQPMYEHVGAHEVTRDTTAATNPEPESPSVPESRRRSPLRRVGVIAGVIAGVVVLLIAAVFLWPLGKESLQTAIPRTLPFQAAESEAQAVVSADETNAEVQPSCRSLLRSHGKQRAKTVLMLHGYTACPGQFAELAQFFFDKGYNVYVPRAPRHGVIDTLAHADVTADELVTYANESLNITAGLGEEVGVIGLSGGGVLATWLAEYRGDAVDRLMVLSPFYRPASAQAPAFAVKPLIVLFGFRLLPDHINGEGFSFRALSQYLRIVENYRDKPQSPSLQAVAVVTSVDDTFIDLPTAQDLPAALAADTGASFVKDVVPGGQGLTHDIVDPTPAGGAARRLYPRYFALYEGSSPM